MSIKEALKPCPFCNGMAELLNGGPGNWFVRCTNCKCTTNDVQKYHAVELWNTRATFQPEGERREAIASKCADTIIDNAAKKIGRGAIHTFICDTILASGLVQDEAGWRDIASVPSNIPVDLICQDTDDDQYRFCDATIVDRDPYSFTYEDSNGRHLYYPHENGMWPTHWMPAPAPPIRSARGRTCNSVTPSGDDLGLCCGYPDYDSISDVPDAIRRLSAGPENIAAANDGEDRR